MKLYLQGLRNEGIFYEGVINRILNDLVAACRPRWMQVESRWTARGGIHSEAVVNVTVWHRTEAARSRWRYRKSR